MRKAQGNGHALTSEERANRLWGKKEAAEYLGVSERWLIKEGVYKKLLPHYRPPSSNQILFRKTDLDDAINSWRHDYADGSSPRKGRHRKSIAR